MTTLTLSIRDVLTEHRSRKRRRQSEHLTHDNTECSASKRLSNLHYHHHQNKNNNTTTYQYHSKSNHPMDITVVLLSFQLNYETKMIHAMIGDDSIKGHECARMMYKAYNRRDWNKWLSEMNQGDIIRFNNVHVRNDYLYGRGDGLNEEVGEEMVKEAGEKEKFIKDDNDHHQQNKLQKDPHKLRTIICDFCNDWMQPEAGDFFCKVSKVIPMHHQQQQQSSTSASSTKNENRNISHDLIQRLSNCFYTNMRYHRTSLIPSTHNSLSNNTTSSSTHRKIKDLHSSNLLSDLVVCIQSHGIYQSSSSKSSNQYYKNQQGRKKIIAYVILSERHSKIKSDDDYIPLIYDYQHLSKFHTQLKHAYETKEMILLTKVLTQSTNASALSSSSAYHYHMFQMNKIVNCYNLYLVPTIDTSITILSSSSSSSLVDSKRLYLSQTQTSVSSQNSGIINPNSFDNYNSLNENEIISSSSSSSFFVVEAKLKSIYYDELDVTLESTTGQENWPSIDELMKILIMKKDQNRTTTTNTTTNNTGLSGSSNIDGNETKPIAPTIFEYRPSIITIEVTKDSRAKSPTNSTTTIPNNETTMNTMRVAGSSQVMSILCANYDPSSLLLHHHHQDDDNNHNCIRRTLVSNLLKGMLYLDMDLRWKLHTYHEGSNLLLAKVQNVSLISCCSSSSKKTS